MPRPKNLIDCRAELTDGFPKLKLDEYASHLNFYASAAFVLLSLQDVEQGLKWLNTLMEEKLEQRVGKDALGTRKAEFLQHYEGGATGKTKPADFGKLLTETLTDFERRIGFVDVVPNLLRELSGAEFGEVLRIGAHWKDPGAGTQHGEFTHRIQWFIVITSSRLRGSGISGFKAFTEIAGFNTGKKEERPTGLEFIPLWASLFDRLTEFGDHDKNASTRLKLACDEKDFRCPEFLHPHIIDEANRPKWPLLGAFLLARTIKRMSFFDPVVRLEYIAKKLNIPSEKLKEYEKQLEQVPDKQKGAFLKNVLDQHGKTKGKL